MESSDIAVVRGTVFDLSMLSLLGRDWHRTSYGINQEPCSGGRVERASVPFDLLGALWIMLVGLTSTFWEGAASDGHAVSDVGRWRRTPTMVSVAPLKRCRKALGWIKRNDGLAGMPGSGG